MAQRVYLHQVIRSLLVADLSNPTEQEELNKAAFLEIWPDQERNIDEYRKNHTCGCRFKLMEVMRENKEGIQAYLRRIGKEGEWQVDLSVAARDRGVNRSARGFIREIADNEEEFTNLLIEMANNRQRYQGLAVRDLGEGRIRIYFY